MDVQLYDGRTGTWRTRDVPTPLEYELVLSRYVKWHGPVHEVYKRIGERSYEFIGHAPTISAQDWSPADRTLAYPGYLQPYWGTVAPRTRPPSPREVRAALQKVG
jgi:hypothetical protein